MLLDTPPILTRWWTACGSMVTPCRDEPIGILCGVVLADDSGRDL